MRTRGARVLYSIDIACLAITLGVIVVALTVGPKDRSAGDGIGALVAVCVLLFYSTLGWLIVTRRDGHAVGWLLLLMGSTGAIGTVAGIVGAADSSVGTLRAVLPFFAWISRPASLGVMPLALIFLWFPNGHASSARWRRVGQAIMFGSALAAIGVAVRSGPMDGFSFDNPVGIGPRSFGVAVFGIGLAIVLVLSPLTLVSLRQRFKRASGPDRQQIRWIAWVGIISGALFTISALSFVLSVFVIGDTGKTAGEDQLLALIIYGPFILNVLLLAFGLPAAIAIAILRYRLYDLDIVIKKAVVFGLIVGFIALVYGGVVGGVGAAIGRTGGPGLSFAAAVVLAVLFQPVRDRARGFADRVVYGERATPYEVLTTFSDRVAETLASDRVLAQMAQILAEGTGAAAARVYLRRGRALQPAAAWPDDAPLGPALPLDSDNVPRFPDPEHGALVRHQGELLGALSVTMPASDPMNAAKARLADDLAGQAGLVLRNVQLIEELRASRQRLVVSQDDQRRKIERRLHDGAGQLLIELEADLGRIETMIGSDTEAERTELERLQSAATDALDDLRDIARGIYPPLLADKGLEAALQAPARKAAIPVTVIANSIGRQTPDVEATAYFCVLEALDNVAAHADASRADITLSQSDGHLMFEVIDDGRGFDPRLDERGAGLQGMADRLDAIGGSFDVKSAPGNGTSVRGRIPVNARASAEEPA